MDHYESFLSGPTQKHWKHFGTQKRAGVATPLFSIYSEQSAGIGEIPDLQLLADWCVKTGMSIIQLLPLNDVGFSFTPYDAQSMFALDPMYLSVQKVKYVPPEEAQILHADLRKIFPTGTKSIDYGIKKAKLAALWQLFQKRESSGEKLFRAFCEQQKHWLDDYVCYRVLKHRFDETAWEAWPEEWKSKKTEAIVQLEAEEKEKMDFWRWLQWQLAEQLKDVKKDANAKGVLILGDLPFLVSRDSSDVWSHQSYFKLDRLAGAPPDAFFANGQRWGMPPYHWGAIAERGFDYVIEKLRYAEQFYDFFRIDHAVGLFRIWTIATAEPLENAGLNGTFDPQDENEWEAHGRRLLDVMLENTAMLPCAEDLGVVPDCSFRTLADYHIPGMDVQRWSRDWGKTYDFLDPSKYRKNSMTVVSTHDMTSLKGWWHFEVGTVDEILFQRRLGERGIDFDAVKGRLFDLKNSAHGRLRWNPEVKGIPELLAVLNIPEQDAWVFIDLYRSSIDEKQRFLKFLYGEGDHQDPAVSDEAFVAFACRLFERANESASIFSVQLLQDWLTCEPSFKSDPWYYRINFPGTMGPQNWTLVLPYSLEQLLRMPVVDRLLKINQSTGRI